jgi:hypothetical protein
MTAAERTALGEESERHKYTQRNTLPPYLYTKNSKLDDILCVHAEIVVSKAKQLLGIPK